MTFIECKLCKKKIRKTNNHYRSKKVGQKCATCIRRLREGGHITQKGPSGPGRQKGKERKNRAKRALNSIPRAPQGDE